MLSVRVLGELIVEVDEAAIEAPRGRGARRLLAWLALHPGTHPRRDLAARLWPDALAESSRTSLRAALADLRRALGRDGGQSLIATREAIGLAAETTVTDFGEWDRQIAAGELEQAVALERGELLTGFDDEWADAARERHRERLLVLLERLAAAAEAEGELPAAAAWTREQATLDPLSEQIQRHLMRRLAAAGDRAAALVAYEVLRERMAAELRIVPGVQTRALAETLRQEGQAELAAPLPPVLAALAEAPFVAREPTMSALESEWERVQAGGRRIVLLAGDPGIGKTRTAARLAELAHGQGAVVLFGRVSEESPTPYQPFAEALSQLIDAAPPELLAEWQPAHAEELTRILPGLADLMPSLPAPVDGDPAGDRHRLFAAVTAVLGTITPRAPILLVLDDLHRADPPILLLLEHVARGGPDRLLVLGTYRRAELGVNPRLAATIDELSRDRLLRRLPLTGLDDAGVAALVTDQLGEAPPARLAGALRRHTDGNPFFVEEIVRRLGAAEEVDRDVDGWASERGIEGLGIPRGVQALIGRRLERLRPGTLTALEAAAVLGRRFRLTTLALLTGPAEQALDEQLEEAVRSRVIAEESGEPGTYAFHHQLVRDVCYERLAPSRRTRLHAGAAQALEELDADGNLGELAWHRLHAGDADAASQAAARAAGAAREQLAYEEAAELYELSLAALAKAAGGPEREAGLLLNLADARERAGERSAARRACLSAADAARSSGDAEALARAALALAGRRLTRFGIGDEGDVALLREALTALPETATALRAAVLARLAESFQGTESGSAGPEAEALGLEAIDLARRAGEPAALAATLQARLWLLLGPGRSAERLRVADELLRVARDPDWRAEGLAWRISALLEGNDVEALDRDIAAYGRLAAELRNPRNQYQAVALENTRSLLRGRFEEAEVRLEAMGPTAATAEEADVALVFAIQLLTLRMEQDRLGEMAALVAEVRERFPGAVGWRSAQVLVLTGSGDHEAAGHLLDELAPDGFSIFPRDGMWLPTIASLARCAAVIGRRDHAATCAQLLQPYADKVVTVMWVAWWGPVAHYLGLLATTLGNRDEAAAHFAVAADTARRCGAAPWVAQAERGRSLVS